MRTAAKRCSSQAQTAAAGGLTCAARGGPRNSRPRSRGRRSKAARQQFLLASTLDDLGEDAPALDLYSRYVLAGGVLTSYANIERAKLLASLGRGGRGGAVAAAVLADPVVADLLGSFALSMGRAYEGAGARCGCARAGTRSSSRTAACRRRARRGGCDQAQRLGDPTWADDYLRGDHGLRQASGDARVVARCARRGGGAGLGLRAGRRRVSGVRERCLRVRRWNAAVAAGDNSGRSARTTSGPSTNAPSDDATAILHYQQSYDADPHRRSPTARCGGVGACSRTLLATTKRSPFTRRSRRNFRRREWADGRAIPAWALEYKAGRLPEAAETWGALATVRRQRGLPRAVLAGEGARMKRAIRAGCTILRELASDPEARGDYYAIRAAELLGDRRSTRSERRTRAAGPGLGRDRDRDRSTPRTATQATPRSPHSRPPRPSSISTPTNAGREPTSSRLSACTGSPTHA